MDDRRINVGMEALVLELLDDAMPKSRSPFPRDSEGIHFAMSSSRSLAAAVERSVNREHGPETLIQEA
jgi:hypothetical protein